jgi:phosphohistidine swiveling domain-containing protein
MKFPRRDDWKIFLNRNNAFFYVATFNRAYGELLEEATGFRFKHQAYLCKNNTLTFYKVEEELNDADQYFLRLIKSKSPIVRKIYEDGLKYLEREAKLIEKFSKSVSTKYVVDNYEELYEDWSRMFCYLTVIPFTILYAIDAALENGEDREQYEDVITTFETFRAQSRRDDFHNVVFPEIWKAAADILGYDNYKDFWYVTPVELKSIMKSANLLKEVQKRKRDCTFYDDFENNQLVFHYDENIIQEVNLPQKKIPKHNFLKGTIACKGVGKGRVSIVNTTDDLHKFQEGDVLVSFNTTPELVPCMKKASAIVTNEGGLACHAAVTSRELGVPCIIGTKVATDMFKDGDMVEVDANEGIIRKI